MYSTPAVGSRHSLISEKPLDEEQPELRPHIKQRGPVENRTRRTMYSKQAVGRNFVIGKDRRRVRQRSTRSAIELQRSVLVQIALVGLEPTTSCS